MKVVHKVLKVEKGKDKVKKKMKLFYDRDVEILLVPKA